MTDWVSQYVGLPFKLHGRSRDGLDCWGLVRLVFLEKKQIELPSWDTVKPDDQMNDIVLSQRPLWSRIEEPQPFDLVEMRGQYRGQDGILYHGRTHCGIMATSDLVLHIERNTSAVLVPLHSLKKRGPILWRNAAFL